MTLYAVLFCLLVYFEGAFPFGYSFGLWFKKIDITNKGSGSIGGTNATRSLGKPLGILSYASDIGKGLLGYFLMRHAFPPDYAYAFGGLAVVGHCYSLFMIIQGKPSGKGVSTALGLLAAYQWPYAAAALVVFAVLLFRYRMVSLSSTVAVYAVFMAFLLSGAPLFVTLVTGSLLGLIAVKHIPNYKRIAKGTESKVTMPWDKKKELTNAPVPR